MNSFDAARLAARVLHAAALPKAARPGPLWHAEAAAEHLGFEVSWAAPGSPLLNGAMALLDPQAGTITCAKLGTDGERALLLAHELGHEAVHRLTAGHDALLRAGGTARSGTRLSDYGPRERRELEAEVFAREFLLPRAEARRLHLDEGLSAAAIEARAGLPRGAVERQILDSLLLPDIAPPAPLGVAGPGLDGSQEAAVIHGSGPLLLSAGPGTGKTRTLVARVRHLVRGGADPASVLTLTFSKRAAGEASERICAALPEEGPRVWVGTFHQFGMDLIRRQAGRLGLPKRPVLLDAAAAVDALEDLLPTLGLVHHRNLWAPERLLKDMLRAISRAKDELVGPERYAELAAAMLAAAGGDPGRVEAAERAQEVARVYDAYQRKLSEFGAVDFGDQVMLPALLLEGDPALAAELRARHRLVLVDEYQDVNRASVRLLRALVGHGGDVWAVGDARQAIYRFRGASSASMSRFAEDFGPHASLSLGVNYRSAAEVVRTFVGFAHAMSASAGSPALALQAHRGETGHGVALTVCPDDAAEIAAVVTAVGELAARGLRHGQQAVLCRGNDQVDRVAAAFGAAAIPVLRLGTILEREEVRDLLSLLSLAADTTGTGLPRVGALPRYGLTLQDVQIAAAALRSGERTVMEALEDLASLAGLSGRGRAGLARLREDLSGFNPFSSPWSLLTAYMMDRTRWLADLATGEGAEVRMRCLAVWNLMEALRSPPPGEAGPPVRRLLQRLRRMAMLGEARALGEMPEAARTLDAVHVMTVHASKGLEFEAVHLLGLHERGFPLPHKPLACPPPAGLIDVAGGTSPEAEAAAEEECLFFVALSRARTHLRLYRSASTSGAKRRTARKPSAFLALVAADVASATGPHAGAPAPVPEACVAVSWLGGGPALRDHHLEQLRRCPRRMLHTVLLGIRAARQTGPFARTHDCVQRLLDLGAGPEGGAGLADLEAAFGGIWSKHGPHDHGYAASYRALGSRLVAALHAQLGGRARLAPATRPVSIGGLHVLVRADDVVAADGMVVLRRIRTGSDRADDMDVSEALLHLAAQATDQGLQGRSEIASLSDGRARAVDLGPQKLRNRLETLAELGERLRSGAFPAKQSEGCPRCPHWFACGRLPPGALAVPARKPGET